MSSHARHVLGIALLSCVVCLWVGSSYLMQYIFNDSNYSKPWATTYLASSLFSVYLFGFAGKPSWRRFLAHDDPGSPDSDALSDTVALLVASPPPPPFVQGPASDRSIEAAAHGVALAGEAGEAGEAVEAVEAVDPPLTRRQLVRTAAVVAVLWFMANWAFAAALTMTSVASNTIISSTSGLFTFAFGWAVSVEDPSWSKAAAVVVVIVGVVLVALSDKDNNGDQANESLVGDALSLGSAAGYGAYVVFLKASIGHESRVSMPMLFGVVGVFVALALWPVGVLISLLGIEPFAWPSGPVLGFLLLNGLIGTVLSDLLWLYSVMLTTPLIATIGLSLTIPVAMISQAAFTDQAHFTPMYVTGAVLVIAGFLIANISLSPAVFAWARSLLPCYHYLAVPLPLSLLDASLARMPLPLPPVLRGSDPCPDSIFTPIPTAAYILYPYPPLPQLPPLDSLPPLPSALGLASALASLHATGSSHGAVSPAAFALEEPAQEPAQGPSNPSPALLPRLVTPGLPFDLADAALSPGLDVVDASCPPGDAPFTVRAPRWALFAADVYGLASMVALLLEGAVPRFLGAVLDAACDPCLLARPSAQALTLALATCLFNTLDADAELPPLVSETLSAAEAELVPSVSAAIGQAHAALDQDDPAAAAAALAALTAPDGPAGAAPDYFVGSVLVDLADLADMVDAAVFAKCVTDAIANPTHSLAVVHQLMVLTPEPFQDAARDALCRWLQATLAAPSTSHTEKILLIAYGAAQGVLLSKLGPAARSQWAHAGNLAFDLPVGSSGEVDAEFAGQAQGVMSSAGRACAPAATFSRLIHLSLRSLLAHLCPGPEDDLEFTVVALRDLASEELIPTPAASLALAIVAHPHAVDAATAFLLDLVALVASLPVSADPVLLARAWSIEELAGRVVSGLDGCPNVGVSHVFGLHSLVSLVGEAVDRSLASSGFDRRTRALQLLSDHVSDRSLSLLIHVLCLYTGVGAFSPVVWSRLASLAGNLLQPSVVLMMRSALMFAHSVAVRPGVLARSGHALNAVDAFLFEPLSIMVQSFADTSPPPSRTEFVPIILLDNNNFECPTLSINSEVPLASVRMLLRLDTVSRKVNERFVPPETELTQRGAFVLLHEPGIRVLHDATLDDLQFRTEVEPFGRAHVVRLHDLYFKRDPELPLFELAASNLASKLWGDTSLLPPTAFIRVAHVSHAIDASWDPEFEMLQPPLSTYSVFYLVSEAAQSLTFGGLVGSHFPGAPRRSTGFNVRALLGSFSPPVAASSSSPSSASVAAAAEASGLLEYSIDAESFSKHFILSLLLCPGDASPDDWVVLPPVSGTAGPVRLCSVDNERVFANPNEGLATVPSVRTLLFCMDQMHERVAPGVVEELCRLNAHDVVHAWLGKLASLAKRLPSAGVTCQRYAGMRLPPGAAVAVLSRLIEIQNIVSVPRTRTATLTHMQLLARILPGGVAEAYGRVMERVPTPDAGPDPALIRELRTAEARFVELFGPLYGMDDAGTHTVQTPLPVFLSSTLGSSVHRALSSSWFTPTLPSPSSVVKAAVETGSLFATAAGLSTGPTTSEQMSQADEMYSQFPTVADVLNSEMSEMTIGAVMRLLEDAPGHDGEDPSSSVVAQWAERVQQRTPIEVVQNMLSILHFAGLAGHAAARLIKTLDTFRNFTTLALLNCEELTDKALGRVLAGSPRLVHLDVSGCRNLSDAAWLALETHVGGSLMSLCLASTRAFQIHEGEARGLFGRSGRKSKTNRKTRATRRRLVFPLLVRLDVSECSELATLALDAPVLEDLVISHSATMTELDVPFPNLRTLRVESLSQLARVSLSETRRLTSLVLRELPELAALPGELAGGLPALQRCDVSGCSTVAKLSIQAPLMIAAQVGGCTALTTLCANVGDMTRLDLAALDGAPLLETLEVVGAKLRTVDLSGQARLNVLQIVGPMLETLRLSGANELSQVTLDAGRLRELDVSGRGQLRELSGRFPRVVAVDLGGCLELETVDVALPIVARMTLSVPMERVRTFVLSDARSTESERAGELCVRLQGLGHDANDAFSLDMVGQTVLDGLVMHVVRSSFVVRFDGDGLVPKDEVARTLLLGSRVLRLSCTKDGRVYVAGPRGAAAGPELDTLLHLLEGQAVAQATGALSKVMTGLRSYLEMESLCSVWADALLASSEAGHDCALPLEQTVRTVGSLLERGEYAMVRARVVEHLLGSVFEGYVERSGPLWETVVGFVLGELLDVVLDHEEHVLNAGEEPESLSLSGTMMSGVGRVASRVFVSANSGDRAELLDISVANATEGACAGRVRAQLAMSVVRWARVRFAAGAARGLGPREMFTVVARPAFAWMGACVVSCSGSGGGDVTGWEVMRLELAELLRTFVGSSLGGVAEVDAAYLGERLNPVSLRNNDEAKHARLDEVYHLGQTLGRLGEYKSATDVLRRGTRVVEQYRDVVGYYGDDMLWTFDACGQVPIRRSQLARMSLDELRTEGERLGQVLADVDDGSDGGGASSSLGDDGGLDHVCVEGTLAFGFRWQETLGMVWYGRAVGASLLIAHFATWTRGDWSHFEVHDARVEEDSSVFPVARVSGRLVPAVFLRSLWRRVSETAGGAVSEPCGRVDALVVEERVWTDGFLRPGRLGVLCVHSVLGCVVASVMEVLVQEAVTVLGAGPAGFAVGLGGVDDGWGFNLMAEQRRHAMEVVIVVEPGAGSMEWGERLGMLIELALLETGEGEVDVFGWGLCCRESRGLAASKVSVRTRGSSGGSGGVGATSSRVFVYGERAVWDADISNGLTGVDAKARVLELTGAARARRALDTDRSLCEWLLYLGQVLGWYAVAIQVGEPGAGLGATAAALGPGGARVLSHGMVVKLTEAERMGVVEASLAISDAAVSLRVPAGYKASLSAWLGGIVSGVRASVEAGARQVAAAAMADFEWAGRIAGGLDLGMHVDGVSRQVSHGWFGYLGSRAALGSEGVVGVSTDDVYLFGRDNASGARELRWQRTTRLGLGPDVEVVALSDTGWYGVRQVVSVMAVGSLVTEGWALCGGHAGGVGPTTIVLVQCSDDEWRPFMVSGRVGRGWSVYGAGCDADEAALARSFGVAAALCAVFDVPADTWGYVVDEWGEVVLGSFEKERSQFGPWEPLSSFGLWSAPLSSEVASWIAGLALDKVERGLKEALGRARLRYVTTVEDSGGSEAKWAAAVDETAGYVQQTMRRVAGLQRVVSNEGTAVVVSELRAAVSLSSGCL